MRSAIFEIIHQLAEGMFYKLEKRSFQADLRSFRSYMRDRNPSALTPSFLQTAA
jgi:hypothetical protein